MKRGLLTPGPFALVVLAVHAMGMSACLLPASARAATETFHFGLEPRYTNILFESKTDLENILGHINQISGDLTFDEVKGIGAVVVEIPVASLRTGIKLRDKHLKNKWWLNAKKYPTIRFVSDNVKKNKKDEKDEQDKNAKNDKAQKKRSKKTWWTAKGKFTLHGVTRDVTLRVGMKRIRIPKKLLKKFGLPETDRVQISARFEISLKDYGVKIPTMAAAKVNDTIRITLALLARRTPSGSVQGKNDVRSATLFAEARKKELEQEQKKAQKQPKSAKP